MYVLFLNGFITHLVAVRANGLQVLQILPTTSAECGLSIPKNVEVFFSIVSLTNIVANYSSFYNV